MNARQKINTRRCSSIVHSDNRRDDSSLTRKKTFRAIARKGLNYLENNALNFENIPLCSSSMAMSGTDSPNMRRAILR